MHGVGGVIYLHKVLKGCATDTASELTNIGYG